MHKRCIWLAHAEKAELIDTAYYPALWDDAKLIIGRCLALAPRQRFLDVGSGNRRFSHVAMKNEFYVHAKGFQLTVWLVL